jgi:hypothetical protein
VAPQERRRIALGLAICVILLTTLRTAPSQADRAAETAWSCLVCGEAGATDVLLNLLLFAPLGMALRTLGVSWWRAVGSALALTLAIESAQATVLAGRDASISDVLANTLGAWAGWWLWPALASLRAPTTSRARWSAVGLGSVMSLVWLASGWGLHPEGTSRDPWIGQIGRVWSGHLPYPGTLDSISLNGVEVPNDPLAAAPRLGDSVVMTLTLTRQDSATPRRPVSLLRIVDGTGALQVSAAQRGEALLVSVRVRAARWRVRTPTWRHDDAMRTPLGTPTTLRWQWDGSGVSLTRRSTGEGAANTHSTLTPSVGLGWVFVHPFAAAISQHAFWWTAIWLALWTLPFAWCLRWVSRGEALIGSVVALTSFVGASLLTGIPVRMAEVGVMGVLLSASVARRGGTSVNGER